MNRPSTALLASACCLVLTMGAGGVPSIIGPAPLNRDHQGWRSLTKPRRQSQYRRKLRQKRSH